MVFDWEANYYNFMCTSADTRFDGVFDWNICNNMRLEMNMDSNILPIMLLSRDNIRGAFPLLHSYVCVGVIYYILFVI